MHRKILLTAGAVVTWALYGHLGLVAILAYVWLIAMTTTNTAKARSTENRLTGIVSAQGTQTSRVNSLSGASTSTGQPPGTATSAPNPGITSTSSAYPTGQTSAQQGSGTSHWHDYGGHWHDMKNHTHDFEGHTHNLPNV